MAPSEALAIERIARADVDGGLRLSDEARWNQTADDWAFFVDHGDALGIRDDTGVLIATAAALPYDGGAGWISMVLVDERHRHRGLATRLLGAAVETLRAGGGVAVLDATPAGVPVYRQAGFIAGFAFERWKGDVVERSGSDPAVERVVERSGSERAVERVVDVAGDREVDALLALDRSVWGIGRAALLRAFLARPSSRAWLAADASGFAVIRAGRRATQLGPVIAANENAAIDLVDAALAAARGKVFIDVPAHWPVLARALTRRGFVRQRPFVRMALAETPALAASGRVFAVAGPEFG